MNIKTKPISSVTLPTYTPAMLTGTHGYAIPGTPNEAFIYCDASNGSFSMELPNASLYPNIKRTIIKTDTSANTVTVVASLAHPIISPTNNIILTSQYDTATAVSNNGAWNCVYQENRFNKAIDLSSNDNYHYPTTAAVNAAINAATSRGLPFTTVSNDFQIVNGVLSVYKYPAITNFTNTIDTAEIGSVVSSFTLTWGLSKTMVSQSLSGIGSVSLTANQTSLTLNSLSINTNTLYTLSVNDGTNTATANTTIKFNPKYYYGASSNTALANADILALSNSNFCTSYTLLGAVYNCTGGMYPYYCYPANLGLPTNVRVGGLSFSDWTYNVVSVTNLSGYSQNYYVLRFNGIQTSSALTVDWQ